MISHEALLEQLERVNFKHNGWGRSEARELCNILMPDEEIEELVNGYYEAGFALLVATKDRVLLVDKKPLNYLTVEDIRFDMISEFDYSHRIVGAHVSISSGYKTLQFTSLNQVRLRRLLSYVQARMTEMKKTMHSHQETQKQHLEEMNEQLRQYLQTAQQAVQLQPQLMPRPNQGPQRSEHNDYVLPQPTAYQPSEPLTTPASFERAAAASMGVSPSVPTKPSASMLRKVAVTPQQIGLAAIRRVVPVVAAYSRSKKAQENQYATPGTTL